VCSNNSPNCTGRHKKRGTLGKKNPTKIEEIQQQQNLLTETKTLQLALFKRQ
jgi:CDGSH-type Zn-finger protein